MDVPETCSIYTRWKYRDETVNILKCTTDAVSKTHKTSSGKVIHLIVFASPDHVEMLKKAIIELKVTNGDLAELEQREKELAFILKNSKTAEVPPDSDSESLGTASDTNSIHASLTLTDKDIPGNELHVTAETFGKLRKFQVIKLQKKKSFWGMPEAKQYFDNEVLHRENSKMETTWAEYFDDLVYVGATSKCGLLITASHDWNGFGNFCLCFIPLLYRWRKSTMLKNTIHHEGLFRKMIAFAITSLVVIMAATAQNSFNVDAGINTSNIFLACHVLDGLFFFLYYSIYSFTSLKTFWKTTMTRELLDFILFIPYVVLIFGIQPDGTEERLNFRRWIWAFAVFAQLVCPIFLMMFVRAVKLSRVGLNIEHMVDRSSCLVILVIGELVSDFLFQFKGTNKWDCLLQIILGFMISLGIFMLYFRSEDRRHHAHALRRNFFTGVAWAYNHYPLCIGVVSLAIAIAGMMDISFNHQEEPITYGLQTLFTGSLTIVFYSLFLLSFLHIDEEPEEKIERNRKCVYTEAINYTQRKFLRFAAGSFLLIIGFVIPNEKTTPLLWLAIGASVITLNVVVEEFGRKIVKKYRNHNHH